MRARFADYYLVVVLAEVLQVNVDEFEHGAAVQIGERLLQEPRQALVGVVRFSDAALRVEEGKVIVIKSEKIKIEAKKIDYLLNRKSPEIPSIDLSQVDLSNSA